LGGGECGLAGPGFATVHAGGIDICEYHDYGDPSSPLGAGQSDGLTARIKQCHSLPGGGKPIFVGEAGIAANVQARPATQPSSCTPWPSCTPVPVSIESLNLRASLFTSKIAAALGAGVSGYQIWFKSNYYGANNDSYAIGAGDPTEAAMAAVANVNKSIIGAPAAETSTSAATAALPDPATPAAAPGGGGGSPLVGIGLALIALALGGGVIAWRRARQRRDSPQPATMKSGRTGDVHLEQGQGGASR
jgi:uncharacterized protein HemX